MITVLVLPLCRCSWQVRYIGVSSFVLEKLLYVLELSPIRIDTVQTYARLSRAGHPGPWIRILQFSTSGLPMCSTCNHGNLFRG